MHAAHGAYSETTVEPRATTHQLPVKTADTPRPLEDTGMTQTNALGRTLSTAFLGLVAIAALVLALAPGGSLFAG
jgi:hypothetical protein